MILCGRMLNKLNFQKPLIYNQLQKARFFHFYSFGKGTTFSIDTSLLKSQYCKPSLLKISKSEEFTIRKDLEILWKGTRNNFFGRGQIP